MDARFLPYNGPRLRTPDQRANGIGPRVAERRAHLELTQDGLCGQIAYETKGQWTPSWADISRLEHGARLVSDLEVVVLAAVLKCSAGWLLLGEGVVLDREKPGGMDGQN
ncbi:MAG: helix-turn-helix domain-containing protein [Janthinobacterium lividum]